MLDRAVEMKEKYLGVSVGFQAWQEGWETFGRGEIPRPVATPRKSDDDSDSVNMKFFCDSAILRFYYQNVDHILL